VNVTPEQFPDPATDITESGRGEQTAVLAHDPTTRDRQGPDVGRQYRSVIFYSNEEQQRVAEAYIRQLDAAKVFDRPIVTEVVPLDRFYKAEDYHQDYAARNPLQPYILFTARPKVDKVRKYYKDRLKAAR
jgi:peptide-methionine (S)-S-oxide reductase